MYKNRPDAVVGFGGYPSIPPVLAAQILGIPTILHEQNAILGRANRFLAKKAKKIAISFPNTLFCPKGAIFTGNPVREKFKQIHYLDFPKISNNSSINLLIIGGSQGAGIFSTTIPKAIKKLPDAMQRRINIFQQCRSEFLEDAKGAYAETNVASVTLKPFFDDIEHVLQNTHLVISRSGASTIAELTIARRPAIFVPLSISLDGDQMANAKFLTENGCAWIIEQKNFNSKSLSIQLINLINNPKKISHASENMKKLYQPDADINLANLVAQLVSDCYLFNS
jgi:UDP-N-acetylglucosamine--N-acetylmuramyl-(pentapeptide) pyrophosphoryl-undecaprenol N-acetylglucosamine transferase